MADGTPGHAPERAFQLGPDGYGPIVHMDYVGCEENPTHVVATSQVEPLRRSHRSALRALLVMICAGVFLLLLSTAASALDVPDVGETVDSTTGTVSDTVVETTGTVSDTAGAATNTVDGTLGTVDETVGGTLGTVDETTVDETVDGTLGTVDETVDGTLGTVDETVDGTLGTVDETVGGTLGTVDETVGGTLGTVDGATGTGIPGAPPLLLVTPDPVIGLADAAASGSAAGGTRTSVPAPQRHPLNTALAMDVHAAAAALNSLTEAGSTSLMWAFLALLVLLPAMDNRQLRFVRAVQRPAPLLATDGRPG